MAKTFIILLDEGERDFYMEVSSLSVKQIKNAICNAEAANDEQQKVISEV
jgi:hypothetical protein